ncbi:GerMN domain-containing protein [Actinokineospora fastidiosa]|uniref:GerMN domain-containing protein n=1 Tax=Actinokineospora fastidiosa TaxID=1816 RepID=A0A918LBT7_9PSEU|nr:Gmad2 immunoglobulin-like domain-containing protein [Actinokineospora fastidiosa]GGS28668.1 hypothetical protein GCM10010171_22230 [Actinokineospora fastidiosa]
MSSTTARVAAALTAGALALAGCGEAAPPAAAPTTTTTTTTTTTSTAVSTTPTTTSKPAPPPTPRPTTTRPLPAGTVQTAAYFLRGEKVYPVLRTATPPAVAGDAVRALLAGPTAAERAAGYRTAVPSGVALRGLTIRGGTATVDLTGAFASGGGSASMFARLAQLTFTLTRFSTVDRVALWLDGVPVRVFSGEGIVIDHPLVRADYEDQTPVVLPDSPVAYAQVRSPLRVWGTANTFEAVFHLDVRDAAGRTLTTARVQATSGTGTRGTFDVTLRFSGARPGLGKLIAWYHSPKDGSRVEVGVTPIRLG